MLDIFFCAVLVSLSMLEKAPRLMSNTQNLPIYILKWKCQSKATQPKKGKNSPKQVRHAWKYGSNKKKMISTSFLSVSIFTYFFSILLIVLEKGGHLINKRRIVNL